MIGLDGMTTDPTAELDVTVAICTRNRARQLSHLLESITALRVPDGLAWEVLVIDNGGADDTRQVVSSYDGRLPVRYEREEVAGLSHARNRAVAVARGRYICWADDDIELDQGWLEAYVEAFRRRPQAALFGGRILPVLEGPTPNWFARLSHLWPLSDIVAQRDFGDEVKALSFETGVVPWGANFAIRTAEQRRFPYDPRLGVSPTQRRSGEETQVMFQLLETGETGWWTPDAKVRHLFPPQRQSVPYVFRHFAALGESWAYLQEAGSTHSMTRDAKRTRMIMGSSAHLKIRAAGDMSLFGLLWATGLRRRGLYHLRKAGISWGAAAYRRDAR
jgi:hypothetical protein